jgi:hypothetical protein
VDQPLSEEQEEEEDPPRHYMDVYALGQGLMSNTSLKQLNMSRNALNVDDIQVLMSGLSTIEKLDLTSNNLGRHGLQYIANAIPSFKNMKSLILINTGDSHVNSGGEGSDDDDDDDECVDTNLPLQLIQGLQHNDTLQQLELSKVDWLSPPTLSTMKRSSSTSSCVSLLGREYLSISDIIQQRSEEELLEYVTYYLALNAGGRRLLRDTINDNKVSSPPLGLWPFVLERTHKNQRCQRYGMSTDDGTTVSSSLSTDILFHLLREGPALIHR